MKRFSKFIQESVELDEAVEVSHDRYMRSHGKRASGGHGMWMFTHKRMGDANLNDPKEVHSASGKFTDAKKSAQQWAKKHGHSTVYVMEEVELDEVSDKKLDAYRQKAFADQPSGDDGSDKYRKRKFGRDLAFAKQTGRAKVLATKEEVEQIDEKAPGILRKMVLKHKLNKGIRQTAADRDAMVRSGKTWPEMEKEYDKSLAKRDSMKKALARLNKNEEVELDEAAPKMKGDWLKKERERNREHDAAMGRTPTGRKKPVRQMTSTQRSLASMRKEEVELDEAKTDIYHKHMLKALGKSRLPKDHSYTSAIANNGDFVVKDGGGRTVGRIPKGEHNLKD